MDPLEFETDPYYENIRIPNEKRGKWELKTMSLRPCEAFVRDDFCVYPDGRMIPSIGFFMREFPYPAVLEGGREWMTLMPNETVTTLPAVYRSHGRVVTFGLGLGYFAYRAALRREVESVTVGAYGMSELREAQNIADAVAIHRDIIAHKDEQEKKLDSSYATVINYEYHLKNGRTLRRTYRLASGEEERQEKGDLWQMQELLNRPEAILDRVREENGGLTPESIDRASVYTRVYDERTRYETEKDLVLTAEQARDLYLNGILPDMEEGRIGRMKFFEKDDRLSDTSISLELSAAEENFLGGGTSPIPARRFYSPYFSVDLDSVHTIAWLKENAGLEVMPYTRPSYEEDMAITAPAYTGAG
jgi:hypothetical protein